MNVRVALVEDDNDLRASMVRLLNKTSEIRVVGDYADAKSALADIAREALTICSGSSMEPSKHVAHATGGRHRADPQSG